MHKTQNNKPYDNKLALVKKINIKTHTHKENKNKPTGPTCKNCSYDCAYNLVQL